MRNRNQNTVTTTHLALDVSNSAALENVKHVCTVTLLESNAHFHLTITF